MPKVRSPQPVIRTLLNTSPFAALKALKPWAADGAPRPERSMVRSLKVFPPGRMEDGVVVFEACNPADSERVAASLKYYSAELPDLLPAFAVHVLEHFDSPAGVCCDDGVTEGDVANAVYRSHRDCVVQHHSAALILHHASWHQAADIRVETASQHHYLAF